MTSASERLREARERAGFASQSDAIARFGWTPTTYYGHENGSRGFRADTAAEYARAYRVPVDWLLFGKGEAGAFQADAEVASEAPALVPVYDVQASAGHGAIVSDEAVAERIAFPPDYLRRLTRTHPRHLSIIGVKGESMEPTLRDDDVVMLDRSKTSLDFDGLFVLRFGDALHVKRVGRGSRGTVLVISDNPAYPVREMPHEEVEVVGKVIWMGKKV